MLLHLLVASVLLAVPVAPASAPSTATRQTAVDVARVWAGHPVGFALLTHKDKQYVAYYRAEDRKLTVAQRDLSSTKWTYTPLPTAVGWDSHNYIAMTVDEDEQLHLSGNMHAVPLVYFRTTAPGDASTFTRVRPMVGDREDKATYPRFLRGLKNELIFAYRDGSSGDGMDIYNVYDPRTRAWSRLLDTPLLDGRSHEPTMNAYSVGPSKGPDGYFHLVWVWRDTGDAASNHDLSYARSKDLRHWETATGAPVRLPMTIDTPGLIVDPVPVHGGIINGNTMLGFDSHKRPVIGYHKFDSEGHTQIYNARLEDGAWKVYVTSHWTNRWDIGGRGTLQFQIHLGPVRPEPDGKLSMDYANVNEGSGTWLLDEKDFSIVGQRKRPQTSLAGPAKPESDVAGMTVKWAGDSGGAANGKRYLLRWETLPSNQDRPREGAPPGPSMLRVYEVASP